LGCITIQRLPQVFRTLLVQTCGGLAQPPISESEVQLGAVQVVWRKRELHIFGRRLDRVKRVARQRIG
jgi:hypothetical protein